MNRFLLLNGDALSVLKTLPDASVHFAMTSPPYWGLRDYAMCSCSVRSSSSATLNLLNPGTSVNKSGSGTVQAKDPDPDCPKCHGTGRDESLDVVWEEGPDMTGCDHVWGEELHAPKRGHPGTKDTLVGTQTADLSKSATSQGALCERCSAWRGQLGQEPTPQMYVQHLVIVFRELRRVLRPDGTFWLNLGDAYAGSGKGSKKSGSTEGWKQGTNKGSLSGMPHSGLDLKAMDLKPKDLIGIPWMAAFALRSDGWHLRSGAVWAKKNPMPESVIDRPTTSHEFVFLLTREPRYYYDRDAIREDIDVETNVLEGRPGANRRSVWTINTKGYPEAHFATFPEALVELCVKAGTSEKGVCPTCGTPWVRVAYRTTVPHPDWSHEPDALQFDADQDAYEDGGSLGVAQIVRTIGWRPDCPCYGTPPWPPDVKTEMEDPSETEMEKIRNVMEERSRLMSTYEGLPVNPSTVIDPFSGSGTVGVVALRRNSRYVGIELKKDYIEMSRGRIQESVRDHHPVPVLETTLDAYRFQQGTVSLMDPVPVTRAQRTFRDF